MSAPPEALDVRTIPLHWVPSDGGADNWSSAVPAEDNIELTNTWVFATVNPHLPPGELAKHEAHVNALADEWLRKDAGETP